MIGKSREESNARGYKRDQRLVAIHDLLLNHREA